MVKVVATGVVAALGTGSHVLHLGVRAASTAALSARNCSRSPAAVTVSGAGGWGSALGGRYKGNVCSCGNRGRRTGGTYVRMGAGTATYGRGAGRATVTVGALTTGVGTRATGRNTEIGRASCRERV